MRISELFEQQAVKPATVITTKRFDKEFPSLPASLKEKLEKWLKLKIKNPTQQLGKSDKPGQYELSPWNHLHVKYGQVLVHYLALPDLIVLAAISDHKAVDGGTQELDNMVSYLHGIDVPHMRTLAQQMVAPAVHTITPSEQSEAQELMYWLAADPQERDRLIQFVNTADISHIESWLHTSGLPVHKLAIATYVDMASQALRHVPSS